ncbi:MAG: hypothetical protein ACREUW_04990 [Burkholderiales bacterium]
MLGLTPLGTIHTLVGLVAVLAGIVALFRDKAISPRNGVGRLYIVTTVITCLTAFGIFQHGGFGKGHLLAILTLLMLGVAAVAGYTRLFGKLSTYIETVSYSMTFLFHWIPAITESSIRLPPSAPLVESVDSPRLQVVAAVLFILFVIGATLQVRRMRKLGGRTTAT